MLARIATVQLHRLWRRVDGNFASLSTEAKRNIECGGVGVGKLGLGRIVVQSRHPELMRCAPFSGRLRNIFRQLSGRAIPERFPVSCRCCFLTALPDLSQSWLEVDAPGVMARLLQVAKGGFGALKWTPVFTWFCQWALALDANSYRFLSRAHGGRALGAHTGMSWFTFCV